MGTPSRLATTLVVLCASAVLLGGVTVLVLAPLQASDSPGPVSGVTSTRGAVTDEPSNAATTTANTNLGQPGPHKTSLNPAIAGLPTTDTPAADTPNASRPAVSVPASLNPSDPTIRPARKPDPNKQPGPDKPDPNKKPRPEKPQPQQPKPTTPADESAPIDEEEPATQPIPEATP